jgi:CRISPR-associated protein Cmr2
MSGYDVFADAQVRAPYFCEIPSKATDKSTYLALVMEKFKEYSTLFDDLKVAPQLASKEQLPYGAWMAQIDFTLQRNLFSRDGVSIYPTDNPMLRDSVTKRPMITGATWKGCLRAAAYELLLRASSESQKLGRDESDLIAQERLAIWRLFGNEKGEDIEGNRLDDAIEHGNVRAYLSDALGIGARGKFSKLQKDQLPVTGTEYLTRGRLHCLPSYFDDIALDVFNPRNSKTFAGTVPIYYEVVPVNCQATLTLLYTPFDLLDTSPEKLEVERRIDWRRSRKYSMYLLKYCGVGAKKSLGFGTATGRFSLKCSESEWMSLDAADSMS